MKSKRLLVTLLAATMAFSSLAGCSGSSGSSSAQNTGDGSSAGGSASAGIMNETGLPIVNEEVTIRIASYTGTAHQDGFEGIEQVQRWCEETGINLEFDTVPQTSWETHKTLIFSSGDIPDMICTNAGLTDSDVLSYADQGLIIPLEDLIAQYGENLNAILEENPNYRTKMYDTEGHIWSYPALADIDFGDRGNLTFVNKEWIAEAGIDVTYEEGEYVDLITDIFTTDEFHDMLVKFKEQHPNTYPFILQGGASAFTDYYASFDAYDNGSHLMLEDGVVSFTATNPNLKNGIQWFNQLYSEGLIDPESFTLDFESFSAKISADQGDTFGVVNAWTMQQFYDMSDPRFENWAVMLPFEGPNGTVAWPRTVSSVINGFGVITTESKYPEICARLMDYFYSEYNSVDLMIGPLGSATIANDDGTYTQVPQPEGVTYDEWIGSKNAGCMPFICPPSVTSRCTYNDAVAMTIEVGMYYRPYQQQKNLPGLNLTTENNQIVADFKANAVDYINRKNAEWITQGGIEEQWDAYVEELNKMGVDEYVRIYQEAYDAVKEYLN